MTLKSAMSLTRMRNSPMVVWSIIGAMEFMRSSFLHCMAKDSFLNLWIQGISTRTAPYAEIISPFLPLFNTGKNRDVYDNKLKSF